MKGDKKMILADKIINERKKNGWSQEELAEQLSVSRQSISKWEGAQAIPDIQKIIKMAELFGVTTDYLLKDDEEPETIVSSESASSNPDAANVVRVSLEEANEYLDLAEKVTPRTAFGVSLCIFAPAFLISMIAVSLIPGVTLPTSAAVGLGVIGLILFVAVAVFLFMMDAAKMHRFEYLEKNPIDTMYGVTGMVKEKKKESEQVRITMTAIGVVLCIISCIPLITVSILGAADFVILYMVVLLLLIVCGAVNLLVRSAGMNAAYDKLLQQGDYTISEKKKSPVMSAVSSIYWSIAVVIFLGWSFLTNDWGYTWIVWPIAGVLYGVIATITHAVAKGN